MIDWNLIILVALTIQAVVFLSWYSYKSPARFMKLYGIKDECCKTYNAIIPLTLEYTGYDFKSEYWQCIHCKRLFLWRDSRGTLQNKESIIGF